MVYITGVGDDFVDQPRTVKKMILKNINKITVKKIGIGDPLGL